MPFWGSAASAPDAPDKPLARDDIPRPGWQAGCKPRSHATLDRLALTHPPLNCRALTHRTHTHPARSHLALTRRAFTDQALIRLTLTRLALTGLALTRLTLTRLILTRLALTQLTFTRLALERGPRWPAGAGRDAARDAQSRRRVRTGPGSGSALCQITPAPAEFLRPWAGRGQQVASMLRRQGRSWGRRGQVMRALMPIAPRVFRKA